MGGYVSIANALIEKGMRMEKQARKKGQASSMKLVGKWEYLPKCGAAFSNATMDPKNRNACARCACNKKQRDVRFHCKTCDQIMCYSCTQVH